ncbi:hypothetical protein EIN_318070 [Entamoeba invadens IP1]|uniref:J domain-containing protein n=1 Tax=Entamoeba invadens IP1 TaxID=370355 RepID=A0A0A1U2U8_ENTIV|nr:hypothetical protein EIN_318070 [Entamoeba invadens IP1]ELP86988.1 hypothetical protein EIN_318070 [Entamoeba invadens IP1]|eukprot:XP_004253759.1 hypothetical protein EIN_318070 [Entamoeba invadens IP1]
MEETAILFNRKDKIITDGNTEQIPIEPLTSEPDETTPLNSEFINSEDGDQFKNPKDYYKVLRINKEATENEINKSYKALALKYHPDKNPSPDAQDKFAMINKAHSTLCDKDKRKMYDILGPESENLGSLVDVLLPFAGFGLCVLGTLLLFIFLFVGIWIVLFLAKLDIPKDNWKYSLVNIPLYIFLLFFIVNYASSTIGKITGTISGLCNYIGIIVFFVRMDIRGESSYQLWLVPFYVGLIFNIITHVFEYYVNTQMVGDDQQTLQRGWKKILINIGLDIIPFSAFAATLVFTGIAMDSAQRDFMIPTLLASVWITFRVFQSTFVDLKLFDGSEKSTLKTVFKAIGVDMLVILFVVLQIMLIGFNIGNRHTFLYTYSFMPTLILICILLLFSIIVLPIICCCCGLSLSPPQKGQKEYTN